jgi:HJR/Mrr/RecB family endonuclease
VKEINYFIETQIAPSLRRHQHNAFRRRHAEFVKVIADRVAAGAAKTPAVPTLEGVKTGADFELFCAEELRRAGWETKLTRLTGDQGADSVAEKRGVSIVLQCKYYNSRSVGNKAVQEVVAARAHEHADQAAVVSNSAYTDAAEQLARTNSVLLLHHAQLARLDNLLGINQAR